MRHSGSSRSSADRIDHRAGEDMRADLGALFHNDDGNVGRALLEADGRRQAGRAGADDHHIEFHRFARWEFVFGHGSPRPESGSPLGFGRSSTFAADAAIAPPPRRAIFSSMTTTSPRQGHARASRLLSGGGRGRGRRRSAGRPAGRADAGTAGAGAGASATRGGPACHTRPHAHAARPRRPTRPRRRPRPTPP